LQAAHPIRISNKYIQYATMTVDTGVIIIDDGGCYCNILIKYVGFSLNGNIISSLNLIPRTSYIRGATQHIPVLVTIAISNRQIRATRTVNFSGRNTAVG